MLDNYLTDLAELVNLDCGSYNCAGVTRVAEIMKRHFDSIGFTTKLVDLGPSAGRGMFATNKPDADHYDILFNAHLDTVFADGTAAARPMSREGNCIKGPGCCDCKSGVLSIFYAIRNADPKDLERLAIAVAYNPDEEIGSKSSENWLSDLAVKSKRALVCEAARPNGSLVRARKGRSVWHVEFNGVAAHAGNNPKDGHSAILAASKFTVEVSKLQDLDGVGTSLNVGSFHGGTVCNIVCDHCELEIDCRYWRQEDSDALDEGIRALLAKNWGECITVKGEKTAGGPAMAFTDATKELVAVVEKAAKDVGFEASFVDAGGGSDANRIAFMGTPVLDGVGPAGGCFHTDREYLLVDTIEERTNLMTRILAYI